MSNVKTYYMGNFNIRLMSLISGFQKQNFLKVKMFYAGSNVVCVHSLHSFMQWCMQEKKSVMGYSEVQVRL
jgi:hypothetical protein